MNLQRRSTGLADRDKLLMLSEDIREAIRAQDLNIFLRITLSPVAGSAQTNTLTKIGSSIVYDYCILDSHIWTDRDNSVLYQKTIVELKYIYTRGKRKLVMPASAYKILSERAAQNGRDQQEAASVLKMVNFFLEGDKTLVIAAIEPLDGSNGPELEDLHDFAAKYMMEGSSVLFVSDTGAAGFRMKEMLENMKRSDPSLPAFRVVRMAEIQSEVEVMYKTDHT